MDILLDTCSTLWFLIGDDKMPKSTRDIICNSENRKYVSIASVWEVAIKISINKLEFDGGLSGFIDAVDDNGFLFYEVSIEHIKAVESLPFIHRDPFDRMLVAQAMTDDIPIMTTDKDILKYNISPVW